MSKLLMAIKAGILKGIKTGLLLLKVMLPIYAVVVVIKYSPIMPLLERTFAPAMKLFHLPGDAVVPIISGFFTDEYGVVAAMSSFDFSKASITTIAMIALTAHSLPVESAVGKKIGFPVMLVAAYRLSMAVLVGMLIGWLGGVFL
ncbi:nucleoside recognition domain-containing protein [Clostridium aminobutyricum]|uniref:Nucleoside transporter/FeoB GTPase Gate domain-containing protein n=1 Tax=Clostridium aminobutyricum TaxID=33953 RepID=A0A939DBU2_CLOAM|nr:nucleoside recognition domain-containing protein [Clostridium aminobutyricum]MBN7774413.1 hypothetical protein [Clostridium aminobutyricum]